MFNSISEKTLYIFAACNALSIPMVWALYPETNQKTLEEVNMLFAADSIWNWKAEENFKALKAQGALDDAGSEKTDVETGMPRSRKPSLAGGLSLEVTKPSTGREVERVSSRS